MLKVLSSPLRRALLVKLGESEADVSLLTEQAREDMTLVSYELRRLRLAGLVSAERSGRQRFYRLTSSIQVERSGRQVRMTWHGPNGNKIVLNFPMST